MMTSHSNYFIMKTVAIYCTWGGGSVIKVLFDDGLLKWSKVGGCQGLNPNFYIGLFPHKLARSWCCLFQSHIHYTNCSLFISICFKDFRLNSTVKQTAVRTNQCFFSLATRCLLGQNDFPSPKDKAK